MDFLQQIEDTMINAVLSIPIIRRSVNYVKSIPTHMDYEGQQKAERLYQVIIALFGAVGFVYGFIVEQFSQTILFVFIGAAISSLIALPPWSWFRKNSLPWQKAEKKETEEKTKGHKTKDFKKKKTQ